MRIFKKQGGVSLKLLKYEAFSFFTVFLNLLCCFYLLFHVQKQGEFKSFIISMNFTIV